MIVSCKFHGWLGVIIGFTSENRPIVDWDSGLTQSRSRDDLAGVA